MGELEVWCVCKGGSVVVVVVAGVGSVVVVVVANRICHSCRI